ncbi:probable G-protein coupled receptor 141 isoform X2 [Gallus gallus]|uniref:Probable G-protein coupled receptor 141 n=1 Tax=Gallus gallus gallus TaxID=208526 RepID=A0A2D1AB92_CHICK|nr:probable G-protein coupled receptor 141 isoform X2 [Gallus gallus]XP_040520249.1 probable G-protein coupled receptor 141 isoform X2 [Gallus gallus]ATJ04190.1 G protein-coupled receptor 141-va [Gallus gallus gallus]QBB21157.1 G protein-coupled receptor 141 isoform X1 [Gallus gallus gallus]|eukprot:XP_004939586.1 probable G-protein coupled receptor 141 isoform X2 [Gallus gallus]
MPLQSLLNMYKENFRNMTEENIASNGSFSAFAYTNTTRAILITVYSVAFAGGGIGSTAMSFVLVKMNSLSVTTTAIINLVVVHGLLLLTVPFRLHYYVNKEWIFHIPFCKMVSAMVHIHMYLTFLFYVITLVIRWLVFFQWKDKVEFYRKLHAIAASVAVWVIVIIFMVPVFCIQYGRSGTYDDKACFKFHKELKQDSVKILNYLIIAAVALITSVLLGLQIFILVKVSRKLSTSLWSHQEFWAQVKNLIFICVIIICFLPYHLFRAYYIKYVSDSEHLESYNEVFLSLTSLSCLDLLFFVLSGSRLFKQKFGMLRSRLSCC